jgi:uncharacterized protein YfaS (alpha-2-macroglobulin family)
MNTQSQPPLKNYEAEWKKVNGFIEKGLPASALTEVKKIYTLAKKENQEAQIIKSLVSISTLQNDNREDNEVFSLTEIEKEINASKEPIVSILKNMQAEMYWNIFQQMRWQIYNRTQTDKFVKSDVKTWTAMDFHKTISSLYLQSIKEEKMLQQTALTKFEAIITKGNVRHLRPTLFDVLANRAIEYFKNDEHELAKPTFAFEINQPETFGTASAFVKEKFITKDTSSLHYKALLLYQRILAFHLNDIKPDALIDADLQRLAFINQNSTHPEKEKLYYAALNQIATKYGNLPVAAQAWFLLAQIHEQNGNSYKPYGDTSTRYEKIKAKEIATKVLEQKDSSEGKINAHNILNNLNAKSFQFQLEKVNVPNQPFRSLVTYKNISSLHLRIIKATDELKKQLENKYDESYWTLLTKATAFVSWEQPLPSTNDLQQHNVEIKIDALPAGDYFLLAADSKEFSAKKSLLGNRLFHVSNISFVNNENDYFALNRDNGQPLANASIQVWEQKYDYKQSKYVKEKGPLLTADTNGYFKLPEPKKETSNYTSYGFLLDIKHNDDKLFLDEYTYSYRYNGHVETEEKIYTSVHFFTDRSIYRPGQTVYFKGIVLRRNNTATKNTIATNYTATVVLRDANNTDIDTVHLVTNEYGSFHGKFQLPSSGMNGQFSLYIKNDGGGSASFNVEEYKRPKFYVDYEPIKGSYKVNDNIKITGMAKAYAGNNIDGANVKYRVVRQPRFLYPWMFWRWWQPTAEPMEITHGETKTDKDGKFVVDFTAIPDLKLEKKFEPVFDYTVYADVTDINGETRSGEQSVSVSYKALMLESNIPAVLPADSLKKLYIRTQNMNGEYEPAIVKVTISQLKEEKRLIRNRYWERPDQFVMSKAEYIQKFPYDEYDNESDAKSWEKGAEVFSKSDSTKVNGEWRIDNSKLVAGFYIVEIETNDKNGEAIKDIQYIEVTDSKNNQIARPQYLWTYAKKTTVEPGENAVIEVGTSANDVFLVHQINKAADAKLKAPIYKFLNLSNKKESFSLPVAETDRGGFGASWLFVKHNRFYQYNPTVNVPWSNKDLQIEFISFRDKTLPGTEEKWKVKITGYKKEKVAAEMLAGMYDASLDQFTPHSWYSPSLWPYYYNRITWNGILNFNEVTSTQRFINEVAYKNLDKEYDQLLSINENGNLSGWGRGVRSTEMRMMKASAPMPTSEAKSVAADDLEGASEKTIALDSAIVSSEKKPVVHNQAPSVKIRKNFNETAFFFPDLRTDSSGAIEFSFSMPEALTKWKFMSIAHTKDLAFGSSYKEIVTQKDLMVQPNAPRFMREGDKMEFSSKIVNLTDKEITGTAQFQLFDAASNEPVDGYFKNQIPNQYFTVGAGQSEVVKFPIEVPYQFNKALQWRIIAKAGNNADGEENVLPVLTNRMLVTETMPLPMRGNGSKEFSFIKLLGASKSESLQHHALTIEYTSNPAWYAVQALPYLMEYPYECAEQTWNRYYANSLATFISNSSPKIKEVFEQWKIKDTAALMSNLQKNQELKALLLEETPWVLAAKNEAVQKRNVALLFDMVKMSEQLGNSYEKLKQMQASNGGFVWFTGGPDDRYITQYIVTGIGHLTKLKAVAPGQEDYLKAILTKAIPYLDSKIKEDYDNLKKHKTNLKTYAPGYTAIQYLYMRSFFPEYAIDKAAVSAYNYYRERTQKTWLQNSKYMQGMIALALHRTKDSKTPAAILKSLKEKAIVNEEMGMYWKDQRNGWFWYEAPIETHSLLIEAFAEAGKDTKAVDDLRTWLLKNKQTNNWKTTKATAEACYALLLQGTNWLDNDGVVQIKLGNSMLLSSATGLGTEPVEAGTGYFKRTITGDKMQADMGNITVKVEKEKPSASWGGAYWQYFEDLDKITTATTPLKLSKKLFVEKNTDRGPVITPVNEGDVLKVGDKIKVRVELKVDRDMEYVHMKDMRASGLEPVNVLSQYKWQDGLGYYESTKDASTNFFFSYLRKGSYVFEYPLFVTHTGNLSNGVTTIQCMYAPEFTSHSEGVRINVE